MRCSPTATSQGNVSSQKKKLRMEGMPARGGARARVDELLELVGLGVGTEGRSTRSLSGGERKRVALARASGAAGLGCCCWTSRWGRSTGRCTTGCWTSWSGLFGELGLTVLYVTHDVGEAFALGRARGGDACRARWSRSRRPTASGHGPADAWVARFLGLANVEEHGADGDRDETREAASGSSPMRRVRGAGWLTVDRNGAVVRLSARCADGGVLTSIATGVALPAAGDPVAGRDRARGCGGSAHRETTRIPLALAARALDKVVVDLDGRFVPEPGLVVVIVASSSASSSISSSSSSSHISLTRPLSSQVSRKPASMQRNARERQTIRRRRTHTARARICRRPPLT